MSRWALFLMAALVVATFFYIVFGVSASLHSDSSTGGLGVIFVPLWALLGLAVLLPLIWVIDQISRALRGMREGSESPTI